MYYKFFDKKPLSKSKSTLRFLFAWMGFQRGCRKICLYSLWRVLVGGFWGGNWVLFRKVGFRNILLPPLAEKVQELQETGFYSKKWVLEIFCCPPLAEKVQELQETFPCKKPPEKDGKLSLKNLLQTISILNT